MRRGIAVHLYDRRFYGAGRRQAPAAAGRAGALLLLLGLILGLTVGLSAYTAGTTRMAAEYYKVGYFSGVVVEVAPAPEGSLGDPEAPYHFAITTHASSQTPYDQPEDFLYFSYAGDWAMPYAIDEFSVGDQITVTCLYHPADHTGEGYVYPVSVVKNSGAPAWLPNWLSSLLNRQA